MHRRQRLSIALALPVMLVGSDQVRAIVIDDFSSGSIVVNGPTVQDQTELDPLHVMGGSRRIDVGRYGVGSRLEVADGQLQFDSTDWGYFTLTYGAVEPLGGMDLTQNGDDRIRVTFGDVTSTYLPMGIYVNLSAGSSSNGVSWQANKAWNGITVEIPYSAFPVPFTAVQKIAVDVLRNPANTGFDLDSIITAGPSSAGDFNRDGFVDGDDLAEWRRYVGVRTFNGSQLKVLATADANEDGQVDGADFLAWQRSLNGTPSEAIATPEPTSWSLAIFAAGAWRTRSKRARRSIG
jgi:hypothetical protein